MPYGRDKRREVDKDEDLLQIKLPSFYSHFWTPKERKLWLAAMFCCCATVYAARTVMSVCVVPISLELGWNKTDTGKSLSAFFWGYATTQIIGGYLADQLGGDVIIFVSVVGWSTMTLLTPIIVKWGEKDNALLLFIISRALAGCFQGFHFPSMTSLFSKKISEADRGFSFSFASSGTHAGTILCGCVGSLLLDFVGWSYPFYCIGCIGLLWFGIMRFLIGFDNGFFYAKLDLPSSSKVQLPQKSLQPVPWLKLFQALPFWAILFAQFCSSWTFYILLSWIPTYFHENFPTEKGWVFNVVPWAVAIPFQWASGLIADRLIAKGYSTTFTRKFIQTISFGGTAVFMLLLTQPLWYGQALMCMSCTVGFLAFHHGGLAVNVQDIAPDFAGSVFGMMNTAGAIPGFIGVYVTGYLLETTKSWNTVFGVTSFLCLIGCIVFLVFSTGKRVV